MATNSLVLNTIMEQVKNFIDALTFDIQQIFHGVNVILIPLELQSLVPSHHIENHLALLLWFEHVSVEQVIDFFVVKLQEGDIYRYTPIICKL